jgi:DNA helicase-2/ATP-dependent DNA helicase PcrA
MHMTVNATEAEERKYLKELIGKLQQALEATEHNIDTARQDIIEAKKYVWSNMAQLDPAERAANRVDISLSIDHGEKTVLKQKRLQKLMEAPYFGRVDFVEDRVRCEAAYYIGVHAFSEEDSQQNIIYDWRSPIASMFYDYNLGKAAYSAPAGVVEGEIILKRQYKIRQREMEYMIESAMNINDDVLQKELSQSSDEKMRNIVATIQKEQNIIIRNEHSYELIIQGVAGSGKTSVALHRVAFLLYRYKGSRTSRNIMIISPSKVFSDYIANVLPELGEERIMELSFEDIAARELKGVCGFQTFNEQVSELMNGAEESLTARIQYKASADFVQKMRAFIRQLGEEYFNPVDIIFDQFKIPKEEIANAYAAAEGLPTRQRLDKTGAVLAGRARDENGERLKNSAANKVKTAVKKMFQSLNLLVLYKEFYNFTGRPEMFKLQKPRTLEFSDVFPLVYLKLLFEGTKGSFEAVKHLVVDEMQDYTPVQYAVIAALFLCKKTILGDANQSVNPYSSSSINVIKQVFPGADTVELLKSYRSTIEIIRFTQQINPNSTMIPIERHGAAPQIQGSADSEGERAHIRARLSDFRTSGHPSAGIVCKTEAQAAQLYQELKAEHGDVHLLNFSSDKFQEGIIVTSVHMAKGLEFDQVIVPFCNAVNYKTEMDRSLLYIACTRAIHVLTLTYSGVSSSFLPM